MPRRGWSLLTSIRNIILIIMIKMTIQKKIGDWHSWSRGRSDPCWQGARSCAGARQEGGRQGGTSLRYEKYDTGRGIRVRDGCEVVEVESEGSLVKVVTEMGEQIISWVRIILMIIQWTDDNQMNQGKRSLATLLSLLLALGLDQCLPGLISFYMM